MLDPAELLDAVVAARRPGRRCSRRSVRPARPGRGRCRSLATHRRPSLLGARSRAVRSAGWWTSRSRRNAAITQVAGVRRVRMVEQDRTGQGSRGRGRAHRKVDVGAAAGGGLFVRWSLGCTGTRSVGGSPLAMSSKAARRGQDHRDLASRCGRRSRPERRCPHRPRPGEHGGAVTRSCWSRSIVDRAVPDQLGRRIGGAECAADWHQQHLHLDPARHRLPCAQPQPGRPHRLRPVQSDLGGRRERFG